VSTVRIAHAVEIAGATGGGQDRARVFELGDELVIALADGAGGTSNGATAAQALVDAVGALGRTAHDWSAQLDELDRDPQRLGSGQSTAVIVSIRDGVLSGASVGDSGAWLLQGPSVIDLTEGQQRKPLVGDGCVPWRIPPMRLDGRTLLVASDGLLRYAKRADIVRIASGEDLHAAARALIEVVRLANGTLQDDVAVVLCREQA
jgi:PPM family protein phosphatase